MWYRALKRQIQAGITDTAVLTNRTNTMYAMGQLTDEQYVELCGMLGITNAAAE